MGVSGPSLLIESTDSMINTSMEQLACLINMKIYYKFARSIIYAYMCTMNVVASIQGIYMFRTDTQLVRLRNGMPVT